MNFVHDNDISQNFSDSDDDRADFIEAKDEEFEDFLLKKFRRKGNKLTIREIRKAARRYEIDYDSVQISTLWKVMLNEDL